MQIVSCETNKKFIQILDDGNAFIPDVIYHVITEDGKMCIYAAEASDDLPRIGEELSKWHGPLRGYVNDSIIKGIFEYEKSCDGEDMAKRAVKDFLYNLKHQVPLLGVEKDCRDTCCWLTI